MEKKQLIKAIMYGLTAVATALGIMFGITLQSCTAVRTITNESKYLQKGDTSVVIQTKTIESYNAKKEK